jgi:RNA polymerase sigma-70 factor (ECF subfamily)
MSEVDDVGLIERARRGDEVAFSQLFAKHQRSIYRYAAYMGGPDAADDVVQETFLAVLRQTTRHDTPRGTIVGYLLGIARHLMMKRLAKNVAFDEPLDDSVGDTATGDHATVLDGLMRAETIEAVRTAVHSLPPAYREVVVLCDLQEMDYAGAADLMQCPIGTIRSRLSRARSLLTIKLAAAEPVVRKSAVGRGL